MRVYAVKKGRLVGLFNTWIECQAQTKGFSGAVFNSFDTVEEANKFLQGIEKGFEKNEGQELDDVWRDDVWRDDVWRDDVWRDDVGHDEKKYDDVAYTDGSCMKNLSGGSAVIGNTVYYSNVIGDMQSNNRGELLGIILALQKTQGSLLINTDSQYCINILSGNYKAKENLDMIESATTLMKNRIVHFRYVPAHKGVVLNEIADKYAKIACSVNKMCVIILP